MTQTQKAIAGFVAAVSIGLALDLTGAPVSPLVVSVVVGGTLLLWFKSGAQS